MLRDIEERSNLEQEIFHFTSDMKASSHSDQDINHTKGKL